MAGARTTRYRKYKATVRRLTAENRSTARRPGYTLDHIVPVSYGFRHDIPAGLIGSSENLALIPFQENIAKGARLDAASLALLRSWGYSHLADAAESRLA